MVANCEAARTYVIWGFVGFSNALSVQAHLVFAGPLNTLCAKGTVTVLGFKKKTTKNCESQLVLLIMTAH